jgi:hypothetical protein
LPLPPSRALALVWLLAAVPAAAQCPPAQRPQVMLERFIPADCTACWQAPPPQVAGTESKPALAIDWIVPSASGDNAPMATAALPEAVARAGAIRSDEALTASHPLSSRSSLAVRVADGVAWHGYIGISLAITYDASRPLPDGLVAYAALVERIPACEEGTPVARRLVRSLIGPLALTGLAPGEHRLAARLPDVNRPERLSVIGWVETAKGRIIAAAASVNESCAELPAASSPSDAASCQSK